MALSKEKNTAWRATSDSCLWDMPSTKHKVEDHADVCTTLASRHGNVDSLFVGHAEQALKYLVKYAYESQGSSHVQCAFSWPTL